MKDLVTIKLRAISCRRLLVALLLAGITTLHLGVSARGSYVDPSLGAGDSIISSNVFGAVRERPLSDWVSANGARTFNWATEIGPSSRYFACISRDDFNQPQSSFDSSVITVSGKLLEKDQPDGSVKIFAMLHYDNLPLEVWTLDDDGFPITRILDGGSMSANAQFDGTLPSPGAPIDIREMNLTRITFAGNGTAFGTGLGDFAVGQSVKVHITQVGLLDSPANPHSAVGRDSFPVESIRLQ